MISNSLNFFIFLKIVFINMVKNLKISAKLATLGLLQIKLLRKKSFVIIIFAHDIINKILSHHSNYTVDPVM